MLNVEIVLKEFIFNFPAGTSKGVLQKKQSHFIQVFDADTPHVIGTGECSLIPNISKDNTNTYNEKLLEVKNKIEREGNINNIDLLEHPSIRFGAETALLDLKNGGTKILFPSDFTNENAGIKINGLIWMGDDAFMRKQIKEKLEKGFNCIKIKVGAIDYDTELNILKNIRKEFKSSDLEIRVDANGAFPAQKALNKLNDYSKLNIHSIEQPISAGQMDEMAALCQKTPVPVALDEELTGINSFEEKKMLLQHIKPQIIILKPSLLGGFKSTKEWIDLAHEAKIDWWITSALESNVGLSAISQWTFLQAPNKIHGLGTGQIYKNNITSPLYLNGDTLWYSSKGEWENLK